MDDIIGRIAVIFLGALLMFFVPTTIVSVKADHNAQTYIDNATVEFVDNVRTTGKITGSEYEKFANAVNSAHTPCVINIYHGSSYVTPTATGEYEYHNEYYDNTDILEEVLDESGDKTYELKNGDYIKVEVYNETPTLGSRLLGIFTINYNPNQTLYTSYGGYVGNNIQG